MKKKLAVLLALTLMSGMVGCEKQGAGKPTETSTEVTTQEASVVINDSEAPAEVTDEEKTEESTTEEAKKEQEESKVSIVFDDKTDNRSNDDGDVVLEVYYAHPIVTVDGNADATDTINAEIEADKEMFFTNCDSMEEEALLAFADGFMEDMPPFANEVRFSEKRIDDKVVSFMKSQYSHNGGAHGNIYANGWNFDVQTGKRLQLGDLAEDQDAFFAKIKEYVLQLCRSEEYSSRLYPDYETTIDIVLQNDVWYFDHEGITFIANPYEIAAYAEGMIFFTIPYSELEGLKEAYTYDGGYRKGVAVGETVRVDLDGDGTEDELTLNMEENSDYVYVPQLNINGANYSDIFDENQCYFAYPYEQYVLVDIDESDEFIEIAVQDYGMSDDPMTVFLRYNGSQVIYLGAINDRISDLHIVNDGKGTLSARERMAVFETMNMKTTYTLENDELVLEMKDLYPVVYTNPGRTKSLLQDLIAYKDISTKSESVTIAKGKKVIVLATDNIEWVQIKDEDDNIYYVHLVNHYLIDMDGNEVDSREVFDPIIQAG